MILSQKKKYPVCLDFQTITDRPTNQATDEHAGSKESFTSKNINEFLYQCGWYYFEYWTQGIYIYTWKKNLKRRQPEFRSSFLHHFFPLILSQFRYFCHFFCYFSGRRWLRLLGLTERRFGWSVPPRPDPSKLSAGKMKAVSCWQTPILNAFNAGL